MNYQLKTVKNNMACDIQLKVIDKFKDLNLIKSTREILNAGEFNIHNEDYSDRAKQMYGLKRDDQLFDIEVMPRTSIRARTVMRAVPNEDFFNTIQSKIDDTIVNDEVVEPILEKPEINPIFVTNQQLVDSSEPLTNKDLQDKLKQEFDELQNLINCIWK